VRKQVQPVRENCSLSENRFSQQVKSSTGEKTSSTGEKTSSAGGEKLEPVRK
jgi:hypothetical protein